MLWNLIALHPFFRRGARRDVSSDRLLNGSGVYSRAGPLGDGATGRVRVYPSRFAPLACESWISSTPAILAAHSRRRRLRPSISPKLLTSLLQG